MASEQMKHVGFDDPLFRGGFSDCTVMKLGKHGPIFIVTSASGFVCVRKRLHVCDRAEKEVAYHQTLSHDHLVRTIGIIRKQEEVQENAQYVANRLNMQAKIMPTVSIFMEKCSTSLFVMLERRMTNGDDACQFAASEAMGWFGQILMGAEFLHGKNLCHNNISPKNILLSQDGRLKLADFSKMCKNDEEHLFGDDIEYMPPEQSKQAVKTSWTTDVYSCAVVFGEMLYRKKPTTGRYGPFNDGIFLIMPGPVLESFKKMTTADRNERPPASDVLRLIFMSSAVQSPSKQIFQMSQQNTALRNLLAEPETEIERLRTELYNVQLSASDQIGKLKAELDFANRHHRIYRDAVADREVCKQL